MQRASIRARRSQATRATPPTPVHAGAHHLHPRRRPWGPPAAARRAPATHSSGSCGEIDGGARRLGRRAAARRRRAGAVRRARRGGEHGGFGVSQRPRVGRATVPAGRLRARARTRAPPGARRRARGAARRSRRPRAPPRAPRWPRTVDGRLGGAADADGGRTVLPRGGRPRSRPARDGVAEQPPSRLAARRQAARAVGPRRARARADALSYRGAIRCARPREQSLGGARGRARRDRVTDGGGCRRRKERTRPRLRQPRLQACDDEDITRTRGARAAARRRAPRRLQRSPLAVGHERADACVRARCPARSSRSQCEVLPAAMRLASLRRRRAATRKPPPPSRLSVRRGSTPATSTPARSSRCRGRRARRAPSTMRAAGGRARWAAVGAALARARRAAGVRRASPPRAAAPAATSAISGASASSWAGTAATRRPRTTATPRRRGGAIAR